MRISHLLREVLSSQEFSEIVELPEFAVRYVMSDQKP